MKFLLKQQIDFKKEGTIYHVYPNQFSSQLIKKANKEGLIWKTIKKEFGKYYIVDHYDIFENDFNRLLKEHSKRIETKRTRFYKLLPINQLFLILNYIFTRNNRAKEVKTYSARNKAYDDKQEFLKLALEIAKNIRNKNFSYGIQADPGTKGNFYIYYFQLGNRQVSFHSPILYDNVPDFQGQWIGKRNQSFPFRLPKIRF